MQELANYGYWSTTGIFTPLNTRRMMDIEYISEISIAILHGHQNKKETLDEHYLAYEEEFDERDELISKFQKTIFELEQLYPDLKNTRWRKKSDFYSLFILLASKHDSLPLPPENRKIARELLDKFAGRINAIVSGKADFEPSEPEQEYAKSIRASSDFSNRKRRHEALESLLSDLFKISSNALEIAHIAPMQEGLFGDTEDE
jgi:hypothetical protein